MNVKRILAFTICLFTIFISAAQDNLVQFIFAKESKGNGVFIFSIKAKPSPGIKLFSIQKISDELPVNTTIVFDSAVQSFLADSLTEKGKPNTAIDSSLNSIIKFFEGDAEWQQKLQLKPGDSIRLKGVINYYYKNG